MGERHREPRNGAKEFLQRRFFRPVPGLVNWLREPTAHAVGYVVSPSGLGALLAAMPLCGAANPGCRRLPAGGWSFYIFRADCFDSITSQRRAAGPKSSLSILSSIDRPTFMWHPVLCPC